LDNLSNAWLQSTRMKGGEVVKKELPK
jgi:hypothetical protein